MIEKAQERPAAAPPTVRPGIVDTGVHPPRSADEIRQYMSMPRRGIVGDKFISALAAGGPGRELGVRLDLLRSLGLRYAWHRMRADRENARLADSRAAIYQAFWEDAARELEAEVVELSGGLLEIRRGSKSTRVWQQFVMLDDSVTLRFALEKVLVVRLIADAGLPVPEQLPFQSRDRRAAVRFLERVNGSCVVKPAGGTSGGIGTTSGIRSADQLARAVVRAARFGPELAIERQVEGTVYRLLFLEGELLDVLRWLPPRVTGDGRSTIGELIAAENRRRIASGGGARQMLVSIDLDCIFTLAAAGLTLASVLPPGQTVAVKLVTNQSGIQDTESVRKLLSPELVAEAAAAARLVGVKLAGVDVISPDPGVSLAASGGVIIEVNGGPGLHYHYNVADRAGATRVAVPILRRLLS